MSLAPKKQLTSEEFLSFERGSPDRHQFWNGEVFAMRGGTHSHAKISANIMIALGQVLSRRGCSVYGSDMRVAVPSRSGFSYPDVSAHCGDPRFGEGPSDTLLNPQLLVEVLSDGTEAFDRGDKFNGYQSILSLQHYLLASQHEMRLELYTRQANNTWLLRNFEAGETVGFEVPSCELRVDDAYLGVTLVPRRSPEPG